MLTDIADECRSEGDEELVELAGQNGITVQLLHEGQQLQDGELLFQFFIPFTAALLCNIRKHQILYPDYFKLCLLQ